HRWSQKWYHSAIAPPQDAAATAGNIPAAAAVLWGMSASSLDEGGQARFEQAVLPQLDAAYNLARWLTRNGSDAEDVVQDACERALKYFGAFRGGDAKAWFLTVVRHACYDWLKRNRPAEIVPGDGQAIEEISDPDAPTPEQVAMRKAS